MTPRVQQISAMLDMLPETEQILAFEFIKRLVKAWDPDFTKLTPVEHQRINEANEGVSKGDVIDHNSVDWD